MPSNPSVEKVEKKEERLKVLKYRNRFILGALVALAIYVVMLFAFDSEGKLTDGVLTAVQDYPVFLLLLVALCQVIAWGFRFWEWQYFLGVIGAHKHLSLLDSIVIFTSGFAFVVSPGKAAELLKSVFLKLKTDIPVSRSAPVVLAERVVDGIAVILILALVLITAGTQLGLGDYLLISQTIILSSALFIAFALVAVQIQPFAEGILYLIKTLPFVNRLHGWFSELYLSTREIFHLRHILPTTLMGVGVYAASAAGFLVILYGFGLSIDFELILQVMLIVGIASALGAVSFVPNGAGVTELSNTAMLIAIVAPVHPEVSLGVATATALLQGFFHKWLRVLVGLTVMFVFRDRLFGAALELELAHMDYHRAMPNPQIEGGESL